MYCLKHVQSIKNMFEKKNILYSWKKKTLSLINSNYKKNIINNFTFVLYICKICA